MTVVEELKHIFDDILKDRGVYISWDTYIAKEKQQKKEEYLRGYKEGIDSGSTYYSD